MFIGKANEISRRAFIQRSSQLAMMGAASSYAMGLAGVAEAAAFDSSGGYKALVCVFLYGGNDHGNTLIPFDSTNYARYAAIRGEAGSEAAAGIALARASLQNTVLATPTDQRLTDDITYALAPTMPRLKARFDQGVMAPLLNVGPLLAPLTRAQYDSGSVPRPAKLFSHNDQQSTWQSSQPEGAPTGWGGRMGDLALTSNTNSMFTAINATGNAVFLSGQNAIPYQVSPAGATLFNPLQNGRLFNSAVASQALNTILRSGSGNVLAADYARINDRSIQYGAFVNNALRGVSLSTSFGTGNRLADQLKVVAQLIAARASLGVTRQVFMVSLGGFDHHDGLIGSHDNLLGQVDFAIDAFYQATAELGVADKVTTFTASDFGRTLESNGDGSDHGWGGHHFIVGGDVRGGRFYGRAPQVSVTSDDQVGGGRLLPSTSVDEFSATLAKWFGVSASEMPSVAPNIGRFATPDLGFFRQPVTASALAKTA
ncbi:DUF1501 domain-containing protein [Porphyrobacter sp. LM 6]|jgi:uncharacterized protein (DUF1501 family)|uniref:DUF1501 domain-containing protein n=1 Tax=Porphyrobacter sp. LM 6 TaxID=1896196 RepID=UPI0008476AE9|nr:DUF1501 domain-containing protein [Porphyrobacter sp. LM 6]AOL95746.1 Uncharacterized conserved protein, DUF1501 family [Porphyrobacter sp. LM 6]